MMWQLGLNQHTEGQHLDKQMKFKYHNELVSAKVVLLVHKQAVSPKRKYKLRSFGIRKHMTVMFNTIARNGVSI